MGILRRMADKAAAKMDALSAPDEEQLAKLSPAQRERYEYWERRGQAARDGTAFDEEDHRMVARPLKGPAGEVVYGITKAPRGQDPIRDPGAWAARAAEERAVRDEARAPYLAPTRRPVTISRVAARAGSQWDEVSDYLGRTGLAGVPHLVFGAYRVPDRIAPGLGGDRNGLVEWDVVHAAGEAPLAPAEPPVSVRLPADRVWVRRRPGQPGVLDEDLAIALVSAAGMGPERMLGIARDVRLRSMGDGESGSALLVEVVGVGVLVPAGVEAQAVAGVAGRPPLAVPERGIPGVHVALLNWDAIAMAVQPARRERPRMPSPFPYLPTSPQELLRSYLDIVGLDPADTFGVAATYDRPFDLLARSTGRSWMTSTFGGDEIMCADGEARKRLAGGELVMVAYRDAPAYEEGRARFAAYEREVLHTALDRGLRLRAPVPKQDPKLLRMAERVYDTVMFFSDEVTGDDPERPRYCWPPEG